MSFVNENIEKITENQDYQVIEKSKNDLDLNVPSDLNTTEYIAAEESKDLIHIK